MTEGFRETDLGLTSSQSELACISIQIKLDGLDTLE